MEKLEHLNTTILAMVATISKDLPTPFSEMNPYLFIALSTIVVIAIFILMYKLWDKFIRLRCPECKEKNPKQLNKDLIDSYEKSRTCLRKGYMDGRNYTKTWDQITRISVYKVTNECTKCGHIWERKEQEGQSLGEKNERTQYT